MIMLIKSLAYILLLIGSLVISFDISDEAIKVISFQILLVGGIALLNNHD